MGRTANGNTRIYLIRHAQSMPSRSLPDPEWPLSEKGLTQAEKLVPLLKSFEIEKLYTSPYSRCISTIAPFVRDTETPVIIENDLREQKIADGIRSDFQEIWERTWSDFDFKLSGCESSRDAQKRVRKAVLDICRDTAEEVIGISSHGHLIGLLLNSIDRNFAANETMTLRNPDVLCLTFKTNRLNLVTEFSSPAALDRIATHHTSTIFPK